MHNTSVIEFYGNWKYYQRFKISLTVTKCTEYVCTTTKVSFKWSTYIIHLATKGDFKLTSVKKEAIIKLCIYIYKL
jgi:hypothetical protein